MNDTLSDFFGSSDDPIVECSFCGQGEEAGPLVVGIRDAYGPTHWHHVACKEAADATKGTPITPTWDEAMDAK
jgi:hypothetical protein